MPPSAMFRLPLLRALPQRRFQWLLWLALLLPLAQAAALAHGYSHLRTDAAATEPDGKQALHDGHCDLCLSAAALGGGALLGKLPSLPPSSAEHAAPASVEVASHLAAAIQPYRSRAPPLRLA